MHNVIMNSENVELSLEDWRRESARLRNVVVEINPELAIVVNRYILLSSEEGESVDGYKREISHLKTLVFKDELTGVLNRRGFFDKFSALFNESIAHKKNPERSRSFEVNEFSILFVDGDDFKKINDTYGHDEGDNVLKGIAKTLGEGIREVDSVGRFGGEEFVVALLGANEEEAYKKAEELRKEIMKKVKISSEPDYKISASFGVASTSSSDADDFDELIAYADQSMYEAKVNRGKNNVVKWSEIEKQK